jgi:hypothetical protein
MPIIIIIIIIIIIRVPAGCIRDFSVFFVQSLYFKICRARCGSAANVVCRDVDVFVIKAVSFSLAV